MLLLVVQWIYALKECLPKHPYTFKSNITSKYLFFRLYGYTTYIINKLNPVKWINAQICITFLFSWKRQINKKVKKGPKIIKALQTVLVYYRRGIHLHKGAYTFIYIYTLSDIMEGTKRYSSGKTRFKVRRWVKSNLMQCLHTTESLSRWLDLEDGFE